MKKSIAFFDFDGTVTHSDSSTEFYRFLYGKSFFWNYYLKNIFLLFLIKFKITHYSKVKNTRLKRLVREISKPDLEKKSLEFFKSFLIKDVKKDALLQINEFLSNNTEVVIVSASMDLILMPWIQELGISMITNELEVVENKFSGNFKNPLDCNYDEKVQRIINNYNLKEYEIIYAFGDTQGDYAMLEIAHQSYFNYFKK